MDNIIQFLSALSERYYGKVTIGHVHKSQRSKYRLDAVLSNRHDKNAFETLVLPLVVKYGYTVTKVKHVSRWRVHMRYKETDNIGTQVILRHLVGIPRVPSLLCMQLDEARIIMGHFLSIARPFTVPLKSRKQGSVI